MRSKKLMATLLAGTMALSLAACSSSSSEDKTSTSSKAAESKTEDAGKDDTTKAAVADYLKNACFRFRTTDPVYQEKYDKYSAMASSSQQQ